MERRAGRHGTTRRYSAPERVRVSSQRAQANPAAALELLAASPDGCTEVILRAHDFSTAQMVVPRSAGLATAHSQRVIVGGGGRRIEVARVRITEAGRRSLTE